MGDQVQNRSGSPELDYFYGKATEQIKPVYHKFPEKKTTDTLASAKPTEPPSGDCCSCICNVLLTIGRCVLCPFIAICKWGASWCATPSKAVTLSSILADPEAALQVYKTSKETFLAKLVDEFLEDPEEFSAELNNSGVRGLNVLLQVARAFSRIKDADQIVKKNQELLKTEIRRILSLFNKVLNVNLDEVVYTNILEIWMEDPQSTVRELANPQKISELIIEQALQNPEEFADSLAYFKKESSLDRYRYDIADQKKHDFSVALLAVVDALANSFGVVNRMYPNRSQAGLQKALCRLVFSSDSGFMIALKKSFEMDDEVFERRVKKIVSESEVKKNCVDILMETPNAIAADCRDGSWNFLDRFIREALSDPEEFYISILEYKAIVSNDTSMDKLSDMILEAQKRLLVSDWNSRETEHTQILIDSLKPSMKIHLNIEDDSINGLFEQAQQPIAEDSEASATESGSDPSGSGSDESTD
jgi:hypothetical protein